MEWIYFTSFGAVFFIVFGTILIVFSIIKRRRRPQPIFSGTLRIYENIVNYKVWS